MPSALGFNFIGYLISTNKASLLWTYEDEKLDASNVILCSAELPQLLIQTLNVDKNYKIKWYGQGRRRRLLWISFQLAVSLKIFIQMAFSRSLLKSGLAELLRIPYFCRRSLVLIIGCKDFLSLNLYVIRMYLSIVFPPTCRLENSFVVEPFLLLII